MTRRDLLQNAGVALMARKITSPQPVNVPDAYKWSRLTRTLIAEAYNPPFYPLLDYEPERALHIAKDLNADSLRYPAASYYAYFPTKTKYPIHPELKGDPMRRTVEIFHDAGLKIVAYIPLNHPFMSVESKNPEYEHWKRRFTDGQPMITSHMGFGRFFEGCINSPLRAQIKELVREVVSYYPADVIYFDGPYQGMQNSGHFCHCVYCNAAYRKARGKDVPNQAAGLSLSDEIEYCEWMRGIDKAFLAEIRQMIRGIRDVPVLYNDTALLSRHDWRSHDFPVVDGFMFEAAETPEQKLFNLQLGLSTGKIIWTYLGSHTEYNRAHVSDKAVRGWYSYPVESQELLLDGATGIAGGVGLVYWGLQRLYYVPRSPVEYPSGKYVKSTFDFVENNEALLRSVKPEPLVGIVVGSQTIDWFNGKKVVAQAYGNYFHGAFQACKDNSIDAQPFLDYAIASDQLSRYKLVYAPNVCCLSADQCAAVTDYVRQGGMLLATHFTSIADEHGRQRGDFGLADLFGVTLRNPEPFEYPDLYVAFPNGDLIPQDPQIALVNATSGSVLAKTKDRGNRKILGPAIVSRQCGKGRVIYIASGLEAIYEETRMDVLRTYLGSLLDSLVGSYRTYSVDYHCGLMPHLMSSPDAILLHLMANTGDKWKQLNDRQRFLPISNVQARIRVPDGESVRGVVLLRSKERLKYTQQTGWIHVTVPHVFIHDAIHVELA